MFLADVTNLQAANNLAKSLILRMRIKMNVSISCSRSVIYSVEMRGGVVIMSKQLSYYYGITILKRPRLFDVTPGL